MKIIYEVGDVIELADDMDVPNGLAAEQVELVEKVGRGLWIVEDFNTGLSTQIDEKWFPTTIY